jgi:hypothetical protein
MLNDDLVSHGFLAQYLACSDRFVSSSDTGLRNLLAELLSSGKVEIGEARQSTPGYVEFIAWKGTVAERVNRAQDSVDSAEGGDKEFAYWLCLRENVDRFEGDNHSR